jgi:hypothetical protein
MIPYLAIASWPYAEHEGSNRQDGGSSGETNAL